MANKKRNKTVDVNRNIKNFKDSILQIEKAYGKGSIFKYGEGLNMDIYSYSTGSLALDIATEIGGVPIGRVVEIFGPESSGKTTLCLHIIAEAQKRGGKAAFIDAEHALDTKYAERLGVNIKELWISQPDYGEQALDIAEKLVEGGTNIIVIDSVAALVPKSEIEGEMTDASMAVQARMMSKALRKLTSKVSKSKTCFIFINQIRSKIGVMFGNPETTTGGNALKFYASMRLDIRRTGSLKSGDTVLANTTRVKIVKSKVSTPFRIATFNIRYGTGIDRYKEVIDVGVNLKIIQKSGAWYEYKTKKKNFRYQGEENFRDALIKSNKLFEHIKSRVLKRIKENA